MPSLYEKDRVNLEGILSSIHKIENYIVGITNHERFYEDEKTFDSVLMNFVVIGESVAKLSNAFKEGYPEISWSKIKAFRNFVAHNYFGIDSEEIWQIIHSHLPLLKDIKKILL